MNPFRRAARRQPSPVPDDATRVAWQAVSLLLDYPSEELVGRVPLLLQAVGGLPDAVRMPLTTFLTHLTSHPLQDVQRDYVDTFDHTRRCCLYLTYFSCGDTRRRGVALVQFKQSYRRAGLDVTTDELPDHLGVVLEFGASADLDAARKLVTDHRAGVEMLRLALEERRSPWADVVRALCATLPPLDGDGVDAVRRLIAAGPPQEDVGLEPYAIDPRLNPRPEPDRVTGGAGDSVTDLGRTIPVGAPS